MNKKHFHCPKCALEMERSDFMERWIFICSQCKGAAVYQKDLSHLLKGIYKRLKESIDLTQPLQPVLDRLMPINCPSCQKPMHQHGYMGSKHVIIDICPDCGVLFLDQYEAAVMALLYADYNESVALMSRVWKAQPDYTQIRAIVSLVW